MPTTFLHTGDEHLDSDAHGTMNPTTGLNTAWESNYAVVRHLVNAAVDRKVDFYISAGDNFKTGRPSIEALMMFVDAHLPLVAAGIPVIFLDGNHHRVPSGHRTVIHAVADMLRAQGGTVFIAAEPHLIRLPGGQQIAALPWLSKNQVLANLGLTGLAPAAGDARVSAYAMETLERMVAEADDTAPLVMASHVTVDDLRIDAVTEGFTRGSEMELAHLFAEPILPRKELEKLPFGYGALSHIHTPQQMGERYFYAGSPNKLTFTDMPDIKGGNLVTLGDDRTLTVERILTPARAMARIDLEAPDVKGQLAVLTEGTLVQLVLSTGMTEIPNTIRAAVHNAGAIIAHTKPRPTPPPAVKRVTLPEKVAPLTALRTWAEHNPIAGVGLDALIAAAENLES